MWQPKQSFVQVATTMHWRLGLLGRKLVEMAGWKAPVLQCEGTGL